VSRSYRRTPIIGFACSHSEKFYKRLRGKQERQRARVALAKGEPAHFEFAPWDEWVTGRDGKQWFDPEQHPRLMRK
jgi:hypothetical protein